MLAICECEIYMFYRVSLERNRIYMYMYIIIPVHWKLQRVSYIVSKYHELVVHKWLKIGPEFLPTLHKVCILFHYQALHT